MKKYYLMELFMITMIIWCISMNIKLSNVIAEVEVLKTEVRELGFELSSVNFVVNKMQQEEEDFNNLDFSEAFKVMYDMYGMHHLFEWRGRVYTTDLKELRNITITPAQEGAIND